MRSKIFVIATLILAQGLIARELHADQGNVRAIEAETADKRHSFSKQDVLSVIQAQLTALQQHNLDKAYFAYTTNSFRQSTTREAFQRFVFENPVLSRNESASFDEGTVINNMVIMKGVLTSTDGDKKNVEFALTMEDGQWKILGIKVFPST